MRITIVAVGQRLPAWADEAAEDFLKRFAPDWRVELKPVKAVQRSAAISADAVKAKEAAHIRAALPKGAHLVVLDERGVSLTTQQLADQIKRWQSQSLSPCFVIGGADGLDDALKHSAAQTIRLSDMTLPHALARVLLAEQLYRAYTLLAGHPYHRE
jgi:23S rRNA (pseudouridine1915-N3)-methyltransferase